MSWYILRKLLHILVVRAAHWAEIIAVVIITFLMIAKPF